MYYILNANGDICGESLDLFTPADGLRLIAKADYHPDPQAALVSAKAAKLHAAAEAAQAFIERVAGLDGVPQFERDSWASQAAEAQAWAADHEAATPILAVSPARVACRWMTCASKHSPKAMPTPSSPHPLPDSGRPTKTRYMPPKPSPHLMPSPSPTARR